MPIEATEPTVIAATYDKWAFSFHTTGFPCAAPGGMTPDTVACHVTMLKFRLREDGVPERSPLPSDMREIHVDDLYALAAIKPSVATALTAMLDAIAEVAADEGKL